MKATIDRNALAQALGIVKNAAASKGALPILSHVRIETLAKALRLTCTDLDTTLTTEVEAEVLSKGDLTVRAGLLHELVRSFTGEDEVTLDTGDRKTLLGVTLGQSHYDLGILDSEEFPKIPSHPKDAVTFDVPQATLLTLLKTTAYPLDTVSADRYVLQGTYLNVNSQLTVATTDGRRLASANAQGEGPKIPETSAIIPHRAVKELLRLLDAADEAKEADVTVRLGKSALQFEFGGVTLTSKAIEGAYPDYRKVIPKPTPGVALSRVDLLTALRRVRLLCPDKCTLEFEGQLLTVTGRSDNKDVPGKASETLLIPKVPAASKLTFNTRFLIEALDAITDDELIFTGEEAVAGVFRTADGRWLGVIMPMREEATPAPAKKPEAKVEAKAEKAAAK